MSFWSKIVQFFMIFEVWGYPGSHVGTQAGPRSKKGSILTLPWTPKSILLEAFALPFPLWGALGTLKWWFLRGSFFTSLFSSFFVTKMETFGRVKTLIIRGRGCKNDVFGYPRIFMILGTLLDVILDPKMHPKPHIDSLWASCVATLDPIWRYCTDP